MMPRSPKGGSKERNVKREQRYMVPITLELARQLRTAVEARAPHERLLLRADRTQWNANPSSDYRQEVQAIMKSIGEDPDEKTAYRLRHSNIVQMLHRR